MRRTLADCKVQFQGAADLAEARDMYWRIARDNLAKARADQKFYADRGRRSVSFAIGDLVMTRTASLDAFKRYTLLEK